MELYMKDDRRNMRSNYLEEYQYLWNCRTLKKLRLRTRMDTGALLSCALPYNSQLQELIIESCGMTDVGLLMENLVQYGENLKSLTLDSNLKIDWKDRNLEGLSNLENLKFLKIRTISSANERWPVNLKEILNDCKGIEELSLYTDDFICVTNESHRGNKV